ncbi:unnamed protein product [Clonostachys rhizophaga]|uniref:Rhodopsin domain-containing protein n=1 Tax=Clonostachys rhizophaga TaxID=160324 RepID=A0A9N9V5C4_9HYPO|nr:unnamed protein product [Clonostachys rhizophaga]
MTIQFEPEARGNFHAVVVMLALSGIAVFSLLLFGGYGATILNHIFNVSSIGAFEGMPMKTNKISFWERQEFMKMVFADEIIFCVIITLVKTSLLVFYWNTFSVSTLQRNTIIVTATICLIWFLVFLCLTIFHKSEKNLTRRNIAFPLLQFCSPWRSHTYFSISSSLRFPRQSSASSTYLLPRRYPFSVSFLSAWGTLLHKLIFPSLTNAANDHINTECVQQALPESAIWRPPNALYNIDTPQTILWSTLQIGMAIICACLPTLDPLLRCSAAGAKGRSGSDNIIRSSSMKISDMEHPNSRERAAWVDQDSNRFYRIKRTWSVRGDNDPEQASTDSKIELHERVPPRRIRVQKDITVH